MDPERLGTDCSHFEAELLSAGRADVMPDKSGRAIVAALGLASPVAASSAVAVTSKLAFVKSVFVIAGIGAAGTLAVWGGRELVQSPTTPTVITAPRVVAAAPVTDERLAKAKPAIEAIDVGTLPASEPELAAPTAADVVEPGDSPESQPTPRAAVNAQSQLDTLPLELEAIDNARRALSHGNAALASRLLDRYAARFPKQRLRAEATVLRVETLIARGDRSGASRLGKAFLQNNPKSPYARRVRSLIGETDSSVGDR